MGMSVSLKSIKPPSPQTLGKHFPGMLEAHRALGAAAAAGGPLDERTRELILLGAFTAARQEGGFKSHARRAIAAGATPEELRQAVAITMGNVTSIEVVADALLWVEEVVGS
jgi:alkylhydroperoxidase/carboxymuconolactone decarboxylase family protein YurZ